MVFWIFDKLTYKFKFPESKYELSVLSFYFKELSKVLSSRELKYFDYNSNYKPSDLDHISESDDFKDMLRKVESKCGSDVYRYYVLSRMLYELIVYKMTGKLPYYEYYIERIAGDSARNLFINTRCYRFLSLS